MVGVSDEMAYARVIEQGISKETIHRNLEKEK
jgi:hypothetical protein